MTGRARTDTGHGHNVEPYRLGNGHTTTDLNNWTPGGAGWIRTSDHARSERAGLDLLRSLPINNLVRPVGIKPTAYRLKAGCSITELQTRNMWRAAQELNLQPLGLEASVLPIELATRVKQWSGRRESNPAGLLGRQVPCADRPRPRKRVVDANGGC